MVGELNADLILERLSALPELGKERLAEGMTLTLGSSSAILASNASAMDLEVGFVGRVGDDAFANFVMERLQDRAVDSRHVYHTPDEVTGITVIYTVEEDRGMVTYPGAMEQLTIDDIPWDYVQSADHLHLSSYYLQRGLRPDVDELFRRAKAMGLSTSLDTNWDPDETWDDGLFDVLEHVDIFLPNEEEARRITGEADLEQAMDLLGRFVNLVVVSCGADGVRVLTNDVVCSCAAPTVNPVDAVGAGDSFNAGFLSQYLEGAPLQECVEAGLLAGAYSTLQAGGTAAFDDMDGFASFVEERRDGIRTAFSQDFRTRT